MVSGVLGIEGDEFQEVVFQRCLVSGVLGFRGVGFQGCLVSGVLGFRGVGFQGCWVSEVLGFRCVWFQGCWVSGVFGRAMIKTSSWETSTPISPSPPSRK